MPISNEMLTGFVSRLDRKQRWLFDRELLIGDGWEELKKFGWLKGPKRFPGVPKRPPPVLPATPSAGGGGSGGGGEGGEVTEVTLEESAAVRLQTQAAIEYYEFLTDSDEWTKRQDTRDVLLQDQVLRAELLKLKGYAAREDRAMKARAGD